MANITIYTKGKTDGYFPTISTDSQEEAERIIKACEIAGFEKRSHHIHEDGREEWFLA